MFNKKWGMSTGKYPISNVQCKYIEEQQAISKKDNLLSQFTIDNSLARFTLVLARSLKLAACFPISALPFLVSQLYWPAA
jgi:hypothetical protein